jgi:hypothetical protein
LAPRVGRISQLVGERGGSLCHRANKIFQYLVRVTENEVCQPVGQIKECVLLNIPTANPLLLFQNRGGMIKKWTMLQKLSQSMQILSGSEE